MTETPASSLMRRKWHTKSRNGCGQCKARKIKCDEHRPACQNCLKKGHECDLQPAWQKQVQPPEQASTLLQMELLHHFTVSTAHTLAEESETRDMWRVLVPQTAFTTNYVLDALLAVSALHMARYRPERRDVLMPAAEGYHAAGLAKALPLMSNVSAENCCRLYVFGLLTLVYNMARPRDESDVLFENNGIVPGWLYLWQGMHTLREADSAILQSPVSLVFVKTEETYHFWAEHTPEDNEMLDDLERKLVKNSEDDGEKQRTLMCAMDMLRRSYTFLNGYGGTQFHGDERFRGIYSWLHNVSPEFVKLLRDGDSEALCILAFYTVAIKDLENRWWVEGWAVHILRRVHLMLDNLYRLWIRWPIESVGWVPEVVQL